VSLSIAFKTDVGRKREINEDSYAVLGRQQLGQKFDSLIVVADGMGGGRSGDVASSIVAQAVPETIHEFLYDRNGANGALDPVRLLRDALVRANHLVWMRATERQLRGMGTTCVAAIVKENALFIGNVGDSRAYLLREGKLSQLTEDHSEVWQQVKAGNMTREEAGRSRFRNRITRALGLKPEVLPDIYPVTLQEGDTLLLCTDGLTTEVSDSAIARILATAPDAQEACDRLVTTALRHGGSDNVTVVVLRYGSFTPLALPEESLEEDDELPTDPDQDWRLAAVQDMAPDDEAIDEEEEDAVDIDSPPTVRRRGKAENAEMHAALGGGGLAITLILILALLVIAEGSALYLALQHRVVTPPAPPMPRAPVEQKPTDGQLIYTVPNGLLSQPVRNDPLVMDAQGYLYVLSATNGRILKVDPKKGTATPVIRTSVGPDPFLVSGEKSAPKTFYFAFDASGNRYQTNPQQKSIDVYQGQTRVKQIAKGRLKAPASLLVDYFGNIYVIDDHYLYKIEAYPPLEQQREKNKPQGEEIVP